MEKPKVFCIGLSRTGTTSIYQFLETVGFRSVHFPLSLFASPEVVNSQFRFTFSDTKSIYGKWRARKEIKAQNVMVPAQTLFNDYDVFSDLPIPLYYKELSEKFPDSKFIYTTRSLASWLKSMKWMFTEGRVLWNWTYMTDELLLKAYGTKTYNQKKLEDVFKKHEKEAFRFFSDKQDRLLIINIEDKTPFIQRICDFLHIDCPQTVFPKVNEKVSVSRWQKINYFLLRNVPFFFYLKRIKKIFKL